MTSEHRQDRPQDRAGVEPEKLARSKTPEERELEEQWSQGGQDVEEAQHDEPQTEP